MTAPVAQTEAPKVEKTLSIAEIVERVRGRLYRPLYAFIKYPFVEVREVCLATMRSWDPYYDSGTFNVPEIAETAEGAIRDLLAQRDEFGKRLLEVYVFGFRENQVARPIGFLLSLTSYFGAQADCPVDHRDVSKMLHGILKKGSWPDNMSHIYYGEISGVRNFVRLVVGRFIENGMSSIRVNGDNAYNDFEWYPLERVLKIVAWAGDDSLLPQVEDIISLHETGKFFPREDSERFGLKREQCLAFLRRIRKLLRDSRKARLVATSGKSADKR